MDYRVNGRDEYKTDRGSKAFPCFFPAFFGSLNTQKLGQKQNANNGIELFVLACF